MTVFSFLRKSCVLTRRDFLEAQKKASKSSLRYRNRVKNSFENHRFLEKLHKSASQEMSSFLLKNLLSVNSPCRKSIGHGKIK